MKVVGAAELSRPGVTYYSFGIFDLAASTLKGFWHGVYIADQWTFEECMVL